MSENYELAVKLVQELFPTAPTPGELVRALERHGLLSGEPPADFQRKRDRIRVVLRNYGLLIDVREEWADDLIFHIERACR